MLLSLSMKKPHFYGKLLVSSGNEQCKQDIHIVAR